MENKLILRQQKNEITEHYVYLELSKLVSDEKNSKVLKKISDDEMTHYNFLKEITKKDIKPSKFRVKYYVLMARVLGLAFALRLMERGEGDAQKFYDEMAIKYKGAKKIERDELEHEKDLIEMLNDEKLVYASSIVLGLNDALVELTGTLAGLTIALKSTNIIAITGVILGFAASLSMAASEYLSTKEEKIKKKVPLKSAMYTGFAYLITVIILIMPYLFLSNVYYALTSMLVLAVGVIGSYTYYISIAKNVSFSKRFWQMIAISFGVAIVSFIFGYFIDHFFGV